MMATTSSITMQSLGKIVQRAPAEVAKMWCFFVFCFFVFCLSLFESGAPCVRWVHSSNTHCVAVYRPISTRFGQFFSEVIALSGTLHRSHICRQVALQFSRNCGQKLRKVQKSGEKCVRTTSYRQLRVLKKILQQQFRAETVDVHLQKFFSARRYLALIASVKFRIGGPKTARNVQVCAHQKSYRK